ncbi:MAG: glycine zipper 2TM domain-containing protein [Proteobacteria bacterium]|nr:glycine zipper 2TM domain-containing protein [Pseudomonadota bacterium]
MAQGDMAMRVPHFAILLAAFGVLAGCVAEPRVVRARPAPMMSVPIPDTRVYVTPAAGQSEAQLDRDRYECHDWAVRQTGFDPSVPQAMPRGDVRVVPAAPPGSGTLAGAATGAIIGSAVSSPRNAGGGALIGAVAGALIGNSADQARADQAEAMQQRINAADDRQVRQFERRAADYRRALSACLEGRSYTVR